MKRVLFSGVMAVIAFFTTGCAAAVGADSAQGLSTLHQRVIETVLDHDESGGVLEAADVAPDQIFYGAFSKPGAREALVVCRIQNTPHTGGLDRKAMIVLSVDSMDLVAYDEIAADEVWVGTLPLSSDQDRIIFSGISTFQGLSAQNLMYFCMQDGEWTEVPVEGLDGLGESQFCFLCGDVMIVSSYSELADPSDITDVLVWDQEKEIFSEIHF